MKRLEVLAPAGSTDALTAAVRTGADAVYLGGKELNARRSAGNFCFEELEAAARFCHARGVKIYLTLNTLASDREIENEAKNALKNACILGLDAVIVQDMGILSLVRECAPELPIHASTQTSVHTLVGVEALAEAGCKRAVLAREMSLSEIEAIAKKSPIELEVFVHGALCMSVSGQCLMSAMLGSRSANRGLCAQPCRLPFAAEGGTGHDLSLKDLSIVSRLRELEKIGVASAKIEGRMKRPEYVAAAVTACRRSLDGEFDANMGAALESVFSRSGFTDGYFEASLGRAMFGIRRKEDVTAATGALGEMKRLFDKERQSIKYDAVFSAFEGEEPSLAVSAAGKSFFAIGGVKAEKAINRPLTRETALAQLEKCGGTPFLPGEIETDIDEGISVPLSAINALRREALDGLIEKLSELKPLTYLENSVENSVHKVEKPCIYAAFSSVEQIPENLSGVSKVFLPLKCEIPESIKDKCAVIIPRAFFGKEEEILNRLKAAKKKGTELAAASTLDAVELAKRAGLKPVAWLGSNIFNSRALEEMKRLGAVQTLLSPELTLAQVKALGGDLPRGLLVYGRPALMVTRNCPIKNGMSCAECKRSRSLTDRLGIEFPVRCTEGYSEILNSRPIYMADRLVEIQAVDFLLLTFTLESREECARQLANLHSGAHAEGEFTRGLYYRGVE